MSAESFCYIVIPEQGGAAPSVKYWTISPESFCYRSDPDRGRPAKISRTVATTIEHGGSIGHCLEYGTVLCPSALLVQHSSALRIPSDC
jgi:hypothetical protein